MRHFVAYHNAEKMGYEYRSVGECSFFSRKALIFLEQTVGAMVWIINGSRSGTRNTTYTLRAVYVPHEVVDADDVGFDYIVAGTVGHDFDPPIELNSLSWFSVFLKSQSNFSLGINEIKDTVTIERLATLAEEAEELTASAKLALPPDFDVFGLEVSEGLATYVSHLRRERNRAVIDAKKKQALARHGRLLCEVCEFDFAAIYGEFGVGYCEVHHTIPLASLDGQRVTKLADLAIVCSNCHRILHRNSPMPSISELKTYISETKT